MNPDDETIEDIPDDCPLCGGLSHTIGALGRTVWNRCRDCGIDFTPEHFEPTDVPPIEPEGSDR